MSRAETLPFGSGAGVRLAEAGSPWDWAAVGLRASRVLPSSIFQVHPCLVHLGATL